MKQYRRTTAMAGQAITQTAPRTSKRPPQHPRNEPSMDVATYMEQLNRKYQWNNSIPEWALNCGHDEICFNEDGTQQIDGRIGVEELPTDKVYDEKDLN